MSDADLTIHALQAENNRLRAALTLINVELEALRRVANIAEEMLHANTAPRATNSTPMRLRHALSEWREKTDEI